MVYDFKNLGQPQNTDSGLGEELLIAPKEWFDTIAVPIAPFNTPGDSVTVKTAHTFKPKSVNVRALGTPIGNAGAIASVTVTNPGSGYTVPPTVTIVGGGGTGAIATATILNGVVNSVTIVNGGTGYSGSPTVTFSAPPDAGTYAFAKFQLVPQKNKLSAKTVGDLGLNKMTQEVDFFVGGSYAQLHETMKKLINTPCVVLIKDANCGANMYYQLGCDCQSAWVTSDFETATTKDGAKGYSAKVMYDGPVQVYINDVAPITQ